MSKSIVGLIAGESSAKAVFVMEKTLTKKLKKAISEQTGAVARLAYGTLDEYFGSDEKPEFATRDDNNYAAFFANALKKFGVNGPEDFQDPDTKQAFFNYVDANWKAQDAVQGNQAVGGADGGVGMGQPQQAALPTAPSAPNDMQSGMDANDPSVATMAPGGPSIDKTQPLGQSNDPGLDAAQAVAGSGASGVGMPGMADTQGGGMGDEMNSNVDAGGMVCPHCNGTGKAQVCPTCHQPMLDINQDPNMEIGDEDQGDPEMGGLDQNPEDEMMGGGDGMTDDMDGDDTASAGQFGSNEDKDGQPGGQEEGDVDDPFDDEDAYTVDQSDFAPGGGDEEGGGEVDDEGNPIEGDEEPQFDEDGNPIESDDDDEVEVDEDGNPIESDDDEVEVDEDGNPIESDDDDEVEVDEDGNPIESDDDDEVEVDEDGNPIESYDGEGEDENEEDPDLEVSDDDEEEAPPFKKRVAEDFGFGLDNEEDAVFISEAMDYFKQQKMKLKQQKLDPALHKQKMGQLNTGMKQVAYVQKHLDQIKMGRDNILRSLRKQRGAIKSDATKSPEQRMAALKALAGMAQENRKHFKTQAKKVKALHTGKLGELQGPPSPSPKQEDPTHGSVEKSEQQRNLKQKEPQQEQPKQSGGKVAPKKKSMGSPQDAPPQMKQQGQPKQKGDPQPPKKKGF